MQLAGKVAIVTGASKGIGKAIAVALGREGAEVIVNYHTDRPGAEEAVAEIERAGCRALAVQGDTSQAETGQRLVEAAVQAFGGLDILVNNAGILRTGLVVDIKPEVWDQVIRTNLYGYFYCAQAAARQMIRQGRGGRIINVSSVSDPLGFAGACAYCATKGGIGALARVLAVELAPHGITCNTIQPGPIDTPLNTPYYTPEVIENYNRRVPVGRIGRADECAGAVVFMASDAATYVNGASLTIDGGLVVNGEVGHRK